LDMIQLLSRSSHVRVPRTYSRGDSPRDARVVADARRMWPGLMLVGRLRLDTMDRGWRFDDARAATPRQCACGRRHRHVEEHCEGERYSRNADQRATRSAERRRRSGISGAGMAASAYDEGLVR